MKKYVVKVLHHPDQLIPKNTKVINLSKCYKLHLTFHKTFVQGLLEYFGDPEYDVTPYNQRSFIVISIPPSTINAKIAIELIKKANSLNYGDSLTNILFNSNGKVLASLVINVYLFTFDSLDPRNPEHWKEIARNVTSISLRIYDGNNFKEYDATEIFALKFIKKTLEGKYTLDKTEQEFFNKLVKEYEITRIVNELKHLADLLDLLSDDLTTFILKYKVLKGREPKNLAIIDITGIFDKAYSLYLSI